MWNYETVLHRPTLGKPAKALLVARAMLMRSRLKPTFNGSAGGDRPHDSAPETTAPASSETTTTERAVGSKGGP
jgi:hypothetical protein